MDYTSTITNEAFLKLKCDVCKNHLSHFPIYTSGDKHNVCGRCMSQLLQDSSAHNEVYEALAQFVKFPCRYQTEGCSETLLPKDIPEHEQTCNFQKIVCPVCEFAKCSWAGPRPSVLYHCQDKHFDLFLKDGTFQLHLSLPHQSLNLLEYDSKLFVVKQKFYSINKLMELSISKVAFEVNVDEFSCELNFSTNNRTLTIQCHSTVFVHKQPVEIFLDSLSERESPCVVMGKINLEKLKQEVPTVPKVDELFLAQFKCVTCLEYTLPPISYQENGNNNPIRCADCKNSNTKETTNFNLDQIANLLNYPCKFKKNGCSFIAKPPEMKTHLNFCLHGDHNCPLDERVNCLWVGMGKDIQAHILDAHRPLVFSNSGTAFDDNCHQHDTSANRFYTCYVTKFLDQLFCVNFIKEGKCYQWVVQMIGPFQTGFMFELEIIDGNNKRSSLITRQPCTSLTKKDATMADKSCYFNEDQIENLLSVQKITFKIHIYK